MFNVRVKIFPLLILIILFSLTGCEKKKTTFEEALPFNNNIACVKSDGLYGFINKEGEFIIPPTYETAQSFINDMAIVKSNGKYGAININNEEIIPFIYDNISFNFGNYLSVQKDNKYGLIDPKGNTIIEPKYLAPIYLYSFINKDEKEESVAFVTDESGKEGLINLTTGFTLEPAYYNLTPYTYMNESIITFTDNSKHGFINLETEKVVEPLSQQTIMFENGTTLIYVNGKYGCMDINGDILFQPLYDHITSFNEGLAFAMIDNKYGCINLKGEMVLEPIYDTPTSFSSGIAKVSLEGKQCFIDKTGKVLDINPEDYYELVNTEYFNNISCEIKIASYQSNNGDKKVVVLDNEDKILFKTNYDYIYPFNSKFYTVSLKGKEGCINDKGIEVVPPNYDMVFPLDNDLFLVSKLNKCGVLDSMGNEVIPLDYIEILATNKDIFFIKTSTRWGTYNIKTKKVALDLYDEVMNMWEFPFAVRKGEEWFYIDENGEILF